MKRFSIAFILFCALSNLSLAQIAVGTTTPEPSARFQVDATSGTNDNPKGFLPPRLALTATNSIAPFSTITPATGLLVYNTATAGTAPNNVTPGFYYYDGSKWQRLISQQPDATIEFDKATPTTAGVVFSPNTPQSKDYVYVSTVDGSQWTWNGTAYVTYTPPASTPWFLSGGTNDAGSNKAGTVYRTGSVGIGTATTPNASAQLDVNSSTKGFLPPRVSLTSMDAAGPITSPATGLLVYNTATAGTSPNNVVPGYYYNSGTPAAPSWKRLAFVESDNTYKLASTGVASVVATDQTLTTGPSVALNNSSITVIVPAGYSDRRIILNWSVWGDVVASTPAGGSLRFHILQTAPLPEATYWSVTMAGWTVVDQYILYTRWAVPATYIIDNPPPGTYTFTLRVAREAEVGSITSIKSWGISGTGQVFVR